MSHLSISLFAPHELNFWGDIYPDIGGRSIANGNEFCHSLQTILRTIEGQSTKDRLDSANPLPGTGLLAILQKLLKYDMEKIGPVIPSLSHTLAKAINPHNPPRLSQLVPENYPVAPSTPKKNAAAPSRADQ